MRQARAIPARRRRRLPRARPWSRTPFAAILLSLLALLAPELTFAPLVAGEAPLSGPRPIDQVASPPVRAPQHVDDDRRTAGFSLPALGGAPEVVQRTIDPVPYQRALDAARRTGSAYGVTFAAVRNGEVIWAGSSGRARDGLTELAPATPLVIGSATKTFVAATVLQLAEEGLLELDDPVRRHLPELRALSAKITVRQLLDHTSGLADLFNDTTRRGIEEHPERPWTATQLLETLRAPWYAPGDGWAYANTNYYLLGLIVERLTDQSLAAELERRFLGPLGLEATHMLTGVAEDPLEPAWTTIFWASGAMTASATDLARWGDALYSDGLLSRESRRTMLTMNSHDYGMGVQEISVGDLEGYGHTGLLNTYTTLLFHIPEEGVTIALLVNRSHVDLGGMLRAEPDGGPSLLELATAP